MPRTQVPGHQVRDGGLTRVDMNIVTPGQAMVTNLVAGTGITMTETGGEAGTGEVTINSEGGGGQGYQHIVAVQRGRVPIGALKAMGWSHGTPFSAIAIHISAPIIIRRAIWTVSEISTTNRFQIDLRLTNNLFANDFLILELPIGQLQIAAENLDIVIPAGDYGMFAHLSYGFPNRQSAFASSVAEIIFEDQ